MNTVRRFRRMSAALLTLAIAACSLLPAANAPQPTASPVTAPSADLPATTQPGIVEPNTENLPTVEADPAVPVVPTVPTVLPDTVIGLNGFAAGINPLTGLPAADPKLLERRPLMIKIANFPREGRPQAGLSFADLVFEYYIGWIYGGNRFLGVFYGQDAQQIGPIRSGRLVDRQLVSMYHGVLAYGGADERVDPDLEAQLGEYAISSSIAPCPPICKYDDTVYSTFTDSAALSSYISQQGFDNTRPDLTGMLFDPTPPKDQPAGLRLGVQYASYIRSDWQYAPESGKYLRWSETDDQLTMAPLVDRLTNQQIAFSNIVVIYAFTIEYKLSLHDTELWNNTRGGKAVYFRDGQMTDGIWRSAGHNRPLQLLKTDQSPYLLKPGNTWVILVGINSTLTPVTPGAYNLMFDLP